MNGRLRGFSTDKLMEYLTALSQNVTILVTPTEDDDTRGEITVRFRSRRRLRTVRGSAIGGGMSNEPMAASNRNTR